MGGCRDRIRGPCSLQCRCTSCAPPLLLPMKTAIGTTIITNGQIIDGTGAPPVPDATLVLTDDRITYAGPAAGSPPAPAEARRIDAQGGTIMPGLVEAHYHATYFDVSELS